VKNIYNEILELSRGNASGVLVTVVEKTGSGPANTGSKMIVYSDRSIIGTVGGGTIEKMAIDRAISIFDSHKNCLEKFSMGESNDDATATGMLCGGTATLFFEYFAPQNHIYIFGAGHIGKALCYHLKNLDYYVTLIDDRKEVLDQVDNANEKVLESFDRALTDRQVAENAYFVIATYQHKYDALVLNRIFKKGWNPKYVGMVSSRSKREKLLSNLKAEVPDANLECCYIPVGLDIGGGSPDEIAISIIAELQTVRYGKKGSHLRG